MDQELSPEAREIIDDILESETSVSSLGYPFISHTAFKKFLTNIPHLFCNGQRILEYLTSKKIEKESEKRARNVLKQIVLTANITAPSDLWLLKHLITIHQKIGSIKQIIEQPLVIESFSKKNSINENLLRLDFDFFESRGLFQKRIDGAFIIDESQHIRELLTELTPYPANIPIDIVEIINSSINNPEGAAKQALGNILLPKKSRYLPTDWRPGVSEVEIGASLLPVILALSMGDTKPSQNMKKLQNLNSLPDDVIAVLKMAAVIDSKATPTLLGQRVLDRAHGPFGIIHAYHTYLNQHEYKLRGQATKTWVQRDANVAASQAANAKTFANANDALDQYVKDTGYKYKVFLEHAIGQGEATRQRFERSGNITKYFGADLEEAAIERAIIEQNNGRLPKAMKFIRNADIGKPEIVIDFLKSQGLLGENIVMMVGNGFHEIREQTDEKIKKIFEGYRKANILIIFTEESALSTQDLIATGFNTYHSGFRYVHELSGQGLRPDLSNPDNSRASWPQCIEASGYKLLVKYTKHGRTIYPYPRPDGHNPAISVTYFCAPD